MDIPVLETERLIIRPFRLDDLQAVHQLLDVQVAEAGEAYTLADRQRWLQWTVLSYTELARLHQPPYGDRAMVLRASGALIGACGYVPCLDAFAQIQALAAPGALPGLTSAEVGLHWTVAPAHQRHGYATEAAHSLIRCAFDELRLARIVATTSRDNAASIAVMRKAGMRIEQNPLADPPWLQVVGIAIHPPGG